MRPELPVGARLQFFEKAWDILPADLYVRQILHVGHTLPFHTPLRAFQGIVSTSMVVGHRSEVLLEEVHSLLRKNAIELVPRGQERQGWYGHYFLVPKKTGDLRPILNLKPLNKKLVVDTFTMETLRQVIVAVSPGEWLAAIDLKDAYFHVPIHPSHKKFLRFAINGQCYQYRVIPFGLATSPRVFTKVLAPVMAHIRLRGVHIHPYLDDLLVRAESPELLQESLNIALDVLLQSGYMINVKKSQLIPTQDLRYIGGQINTAIGRVSLPKDRREVLTKLAASFKVGQYKTARTWLQLLGFMASTILVVRMARMRMRPIQLFVLSKWTYPQDLFRTLIMVPRFLLVHIQWWANPDNLSQGFPLSPPNVDHVLTTDSSGDGWGAVLDDQFTTQGMWSAQTRLLHINSLELMAVDMALKHFVHRLHHSVVLVRSDNISTCAYIAKEGGTVCPRLCIQTFHLLQWCQSQHILLRTAYIPGQENIHADRLSRYREMDTNLGYTLDNREWSLNIDVVLSLIHI